MLHVKKTSVLPDIATVLQFIEKQGQWGVTRRSDPAELFDAALSFLSQGQWDEAEPVLKEASAMFERRRWSRDDPLWFEILLTLGGVYMQLGEEGLQPLISEKVIHSVSASQQRLGRLRARLTSARAHYLAALVCAQKNEVASTRDAMAHLERARELLRGCPDHVAVREYWRACSFCELMVARMTGVAQPKRSSVILRASRVIEENHDLERMRYGESLLHAKKPDEAIEYIRSASDSGKLSKPAWIIAERMQATAEWGAGAASASPTLESLEETEKKAQKLGFAHQVRIIRMLKKLVRRGEREPVIRLKKPVT